MAKPLENLKQFIGKSETATDIVTASVMLKFAATLGLEKAPLHVGDVVPPGWHGGFFPPSHRPAQMREDGYPSGGLIPAIPLARHVSAVRTTFLEPLRVGDEIKQIIEIADIRIDDGPTGAMATLIEKTSISSSRGLAIVEERDLVFSNQARFGAAPKNAPLVPAEAKWKRVFEPKAALLFRWSAIRFNSDRIHYDRDYVTRAQLPGLVVQDSLIRHLFIEMCGSEVPNRQVHYFDFQPLLHTYDTGNFSIAGTPSADGRKATLWSMDPNGQVTMTANAKFA